MASAVDIEPPNSSISSAPSFAIRPPNNNHPTTFLRSISTKEASNFSEELSYSPPRLSTSVLPSNTCQGRNSQPSTPRLSFTLNNPSKSVDDHAEFHQTSYRCSSQPTEFYLFNFCLFYFSTVIYCNS